MAYPVGDLVVGYSPDRRTIHLSMTCPHHSTEADFEFASREAAEAAYTDAVQSIALTHEERFHCGCARPHLTGATNRPN